MKGKIMNLLVVIDMQNDFIDGVLGTPEAVEIVPRVAAKVKNHVKNGGCVIYTRDTHHGSYLETMEGKNLPVPHCIQYSEGWQIRPEVYEFGAEVVNKPSFGSTELPTIIKELYPNLEEIEIVGLCTDICVISNAMILKAEFPEIPITVDSNCCAGVNPESHKNALAAMEMYYKKIV